MITVRAEPGFGEDLAAPYPMSWQLFAPEAYAALRAWRSGGEVTVQLGPTASGLAGKFVILDDGTCHVRLKATLPDVREHFRTRMIHTEWWGAAELDEAMYLLSEIYPVDEESHDRVVIGMCTDLINLHKEDLAGPDGIKLRPFLGWLSSLCETLKQRRDAASDDFRQTMSDIVEDIGRRSPNPIPRTAPGQRKPAA